MEDFYFIIQFSIFNIFPGDKKIVFTGVHILLLSGKHDYWFLSQCNVFDTSEKNSHLIKNNNE